MKFITVQEALLCIMDLGIDQEILHVGANIFIGPRTQISVLQEYVKIYPDRYGIECIRLNDIFDFQAWLIEHFDL